MMMKMSTPRRLPPRMASQGSPTGRWIRQRSHDEGHRLPGYRLQPDPDRQSSSPSCCRRWPMAIIWAASERATIEIRWPSENVDAFELPSSERSFGGAPVLNQNRRAARAVRWPISMNGHSVGRRRGQKGGRERPEGVVVLRHPVDRRPQFVSPHSGRAKFLQRRSMSRRPAGWRAIELRTRAATRRRNFL